MSLGFHTISLLLHDETTALKELAQIGYRSVAIRPRLSGLNPSDKHFTESMLRFADCANQAGVQVIFETQSPFLCDASLSSPDPAQAAKAKAWIDTCLQAAREYIGNQSFDTVVVFESGSSSGSGDATAASNDEADLERLSRQIDSLLHQAGDAGIRLAIRPRAGNVIAKITHFQRLQQWLAGAHRLSLAADTAQMMLHSEFPLGERLAPLASSLACVFLTDPDTTTPNAGMENEAAFLPGPVDLARVIQSLKRQEIHAPLIVQIDGQSEHGIAIAKDAWSSLA